MQEKLAITSKTFSAVVRSTKGPLEKKSETMKERVPTSGIVILSILYMPTSCSSRVSILLSSTPYRQMTMAPASVTHQMRTLTTDSIQAKTTF